MLSKGGKIEYLCPFCNSTDIKYVYAKEEAWAILLEVPVNFAHGQCNECDNWFYWTDRIKNSLKEKKSVRVV